MPDGRVVLTDQAAALARVEDLVDAELWRADRRAVALAVLRGLVCGMSWDSGVVAGVTRAHLAAAASCSLRTVSRVVAWAVESELVVVVETGASATFLGTTENRAPSYVLTAPLGHPLRGHGSAPVDTHGNPPAYGGWKSSPWQNRGLQERQEEPRWPIFDKAETPSARAAAVDTLLERTGLTARVVRWRAIAMLAPWFADGWCIAGILHALDHHPDLPATGRGDATRSARDPLRVLGHRLAVWRGRVDDLPATLHAVDGHARRARVATGRAMAGHAVMATDVRPWPPVVWRPSASAEARAAARAEVSRVLSRPRRHVAVTSGSGRSPGMSPGEL